MTAYEKSRLGSIVVGVLFLIAGCVSFFFGTLYIRAHRVIGLHEYSLSMRDHLELLLQYFLLIVSGLGALGGVICAGVGGITVVLSVFKIGAFSEDAFHRPRYPVAPEPPPYRCRGNE